MAATGSSIGGISAVNPNAPGNYQQYIDASFGNAKQRLDPIFEQQQQQYAQGLVNQGIGVGSEAYGRAMQQMSQNQNDAYSNAAFDAMGFGLGAQAQDFGQDATRSQLANALLQSKWNTDLGYADIDFNRDLGFARLNEDSRQFDLGLGEDSRQFDLGLGEDSRQFDSGMNQRSYEFDNELANRQYEYDSGLDFQYWNSGNQYDFMRDRANQDDLRWLTEMDYQTNADRINNERWADQLGQMWMSPYDPNMPNIAGQMNNAYGNNLAQYGVERGNNNAWWSNLTSIINDTGNQQGWWGS